MADAFRFPPNPFTPGTAHPPPYFAGRGDVLDDLLDRADQLRGRAKPRGQMLVAPRGYGKTVLLHKFARAVSKSHPDARVVFTRASQLDTVEHLIAAVAGRATRGRRTLKSLGFNVFGTGGSISTDRTVSPGVAVERALGKKPTILVVDETGELRSGPGHILVNAIESLMGRGQPIMALFGGTPKMYAAFRGANVTFWERFEQKRLHLLDEQESRAAVEVPCRANDLSVDDDALDHIVEDAMGYPYFLQAWGGGVYDAARKAGVRAIDRNVVGLARRRVRLEQEALYGERMREVGGERALLFASIRIAKSFADDGGDSRTHAELDGLVVDALERSGRSADRAADMIDRLHAVGFVWKVPRDTDDNWEPGIPSLMRYALARYGDRFGRRPGGIGR